MSAFQETHRREYGELFCSIPWIESDQASRAALERESLLTEIGPAASACRGSKIHAGELAPGCRRCTEGQWSCLFINGRCNAGCFFCPSEQHETGVPTTNTLTFASPRDYVAYLERFGFSGASLSGGEPFLTFDRTLLFVERIKRRFGSQVHLWLYTNGLLHTEPKLARLRDAGLDEIRFNILAGDYRLDKLQKAVGVIPTVTVEIPAVPEDEPRLRDLLPVLRDVGLDHLNLHQIRLTPFNLPHLTRRGYRFADGPKVTVPDSELTALRLIRFSLRKQIGLAINYCSFIYKHRYQAWAARRRWGQQVLKPGEALTEAGYIRSITQGDDGQAARARYFSALVRSRPSFYAPFREVELGSRMSLFVERHPASDEIELPREWARSWNATGDDPGADQEALRREMPEQIRPYELMADGLAPYL